MAYADPKHGMPTSIRIDERLRERIHAQAEREGRSATNLIKLLLSDGLDVREVVAPKESESAKRRLLARAKKRAERQAWANAKRKADLDTDVSEGAEHVSVLD